MRALVNRAKHYNQVLECIENGEEEGSVFVIRPEIPAVSRLEKDEKKLREFYQHGYDQMKANFEGSAGVSERRIKLLYKRKRIGEEDGVEKPEEPGNYTDADVLPGPERKVPIRSITRICTGKGYRGVIFDIDNTLVPHGAPATKGGGCVLCVSSGDWFSTCLLSNNQKPRWLRLPMRSVLSISKMRTSLR